MFQFPGFSPLARYYVFNIVGCPIQTSTDQCSFATPRSFSQLTTSFVVSRSLGIPRTPLFASLNVYFFLSINTRLSLLPVLSMIFFGTLNTTQLPSSSPLVQPFLLISPISFQLSAPDLLSFTHASFQSFYLFTL